MEPDLSVPLFSGLALSSPFWIASSHLTENENAIRALQPYQPAAVTLKTTSERTGGSGQGERLYRPLHVRAGADKPHAWYCDGDKSRELLNLETTRRLLGTAKTAMPNTLVGVSILQGEDYDRAAKELAGGDFAELNLKYSGRLGPKGKRSSWLKFQQGQLDLICRDVRAFSESFGSLPHFVKLTRDFVWLRPCAEWFQFADVIRALVANGRRVGLIFANSPKLRVPSAWLGPRSRREDPDELAGGVLVGSPLFLDTYNIIRSLSMETPEFENIPIVASGGIMGLSESIDVWMAGAIAVQLCSALVAERPHYYSWLVGQLREVMRAEVVDTFPALLRKLRHERSSGLRSLRHHVQSKERDFDKFVASRLEDGSEQVRAALRTFICDGARDTLSSWAGSPPPGLRVEGWDGAELTSSGVPTMVESMANDTDLFPEHADVIAQDTPLRVLSMLGATMAHAFFLDLRETGFPRLDIQRWDTSSEVAARLMRGPSWDLAVMSEAYVEDLLGIPRRASHAPIVLGAIGDGSYVLRAFRPGSTIRAIYHFGGKQSESATRSLVASTADLSSVQVHSATVSQIARILTVPNDSIGVFAKDPICRIYEILADVALDTRTTVSCRHLLLVSRAFYERFRVAGVRQLCRQLKQACEGLCANPDRGVELLVRDNVIEKLRDFLSK